MHIIFDNLIAIMFVFVFYPSLNGLFDFVNPNVGCIFMVTGKYNFAVSFLFYVKAIPFLLKKPWFIFLVNELYAFDFLETHMMFFLVPLELIFVVACL